MMIIKYSVKISASLEEKMNSNWLIFFAFTNEHLTVLKFISTIFS